MSINYKYLGKLNSHSQLCELSLDELSDMAKEIRHRITTVVGENGGHLASNLGVTELTLALHRVFDFQRDRLVWDVGHQCYVHKLLTGRCDQFDSLRQADGISGFPCPDESDTDQFAVGHAGTAIATAVGLALGAQIQQTDEKIVAVVGDASIVNGVAFEGLNNTSLVQRPLLVILNDNSMAISKTEGAFAQYLMRLRVSRPVEDLQRRTKMLVRRMPYVGKRLADSLVRIKEGIKTTLLGPYQSFEQLGMIYLGPVDGHDTASLIKLLSMLKDIDHPVLLHVVTEKGRGFAPAIEDPCRFHSPAAFVVEGETAKLPGSNGKSFTTAFAESLAGLMRSDDRIVAMTAAMPDGTGVSKLQKEFPDRAIDVGIAESACVDIAAGLAKTGMRPVASIYSTFMQRAFDQIFQEVALQNLPVTFCLDRAGLVGGDGAVHQGFCDITLLRSLPNFVLMAPIDEIEMRQSLELATKLDQPSAIRYPRDQISKDLSESPEKQSQPFEVGKAITLRQGRQVVILSYGAIANQALLAAEKLASEGINITVVNARFVKPLDETLITQILTDQTIKTVITLEDHGLTGGFGSAVLEFACQAGLDTRKIIRLGLPDRFIAQNTRQGQLVEVGIDADSIVEKVRQVFAKDLAENPLQEKTQREHNRVNI